MIKCAIFDLDGTLVNTIDDLKRACEYVLNHYKKESAKTTNDYKMMVGDGAKKLVQRAFDDDIDPVELDKAYAMFKTKYNEILLDNAYVYDGIGQALDEIKNQGVKLAVVSNKPHEATVKMVESLFGKDYFDFIIGGKDDTPKKPDPTTTLMALNALGCESEQAIYFGDSDTDMKTAHNAKIEAVGCSWGFRSFECLFAQNPSIIIDDPKYIPKLI